MDATRRKELGKFVLDLGKLMFGGFIVSGFLSGGWPGAVRVIAGLVATTAAAAIGLLIVPPGD